MILLSYSTVSTILQILSTSLWHVLSLFCTFAIDDIRHLITFILSSRVGPSGIHVERIFIEKLSVSFLEISNPFLLPNKFMICHVSCQDFIDLPLIVRVSCDSCFISKTILVLLSVTLASVRLENAAVITSGSSW